jgi:putative ABC transport system substrate-binding protein
VTSRRAFIGAALLGMVATPRTIGAQGRKVARIGVLSPFAPSNGPAPSFDFFHERLRDLGYVEGRNIVFEYGWAEGRYDRLPAIAVELVQSKVDILLTAWSTPAAMAAKRATTTIPIVFIGVGDAVGVRLVDGLARPGGNITGSTFQSEETVGKLLQLLKEVVPKLSRLATVSNPANPVYEPVLKDVEAIGRTLGLQVLRLGITGSSDVDAAFDSARRERVDGLVVMRDFVLISQRDRIVALAAKNRMPVMYGMREFVDAGGLMSFEPSLPELHRRAADLVHEILQGARPAELPVEQSSQFELVINMKTAKKLGLTIPEPVLLRAEQVLE